MITWTKYSRHWASGRAAKTTSHCQNQKPALTTSWVHWWDFGETRKRFDWRLWRWAGLVCLPEIGWLIGHFGRAGQYEFDLCSPVRDIRSSHRWYEESKNVSGQARVIFIPFSKRICLVKGSIRPFARPPKFGSLQRRFPTTYEAPLRNLVLQDTKVPPVVELAIVEEALETLISPFEACAHHPVELGADLSLSSQDHPPDFLAKANLSDLGSKGDHLIPKAPLPLSKSQGEATQFVHPLLLTLGMDTSILSQPFL